MKSFHTFRLDTVNHCLWCEEERLLSRQRLSTSCDYLVEHADRLVHTRRDSRNVVAGNVRQSGNRKEICIRNPQGSGRPSPTNPPLLRLFLAADINSSLLFTTKRLRPHAPATKSYGKSSVAKARCSTLTDAFDKALQGHRQIVFITGEAGIGKTTLVEVFCKVQLWSGNTRIARGQCVEGFGGKEAYYPVLDALGQLFREAGNAPALANPLETGADLARSVPFAGQTRATRSARERNRRRPPANEWCARFAKLWKSLRRKCRWFCCWKIFTGLTHPRWILFRRWRAAVARQSCCCLEPTARLKSSFREVL